MKKSLFWALFVIVWSGFRPRLPCRRSSGRRGPVSRTRVSPPSTPGTVLKAGKLFSRAIKLAPSYPHAHRGLGDLAMEQSDYPEAVKKYRAQLAGYPDPAAIPGVAHFQLGQALLRSERWGEAIAAYELGIAADPLLAEAHHQLAQAYWNTGRIQDAGTESGAGDKARLPGPTRVGRAARRPGARPRAILDGGRCRTDAPDLPDRTDGAARRRRLRCSVAIDRHLSGPHPRRSSPRARCGPRSWLGWDATRSRKPTSNSRLRWRRSPSTCATRLAALHRLTGRPHLALRGPACAGRSDGGSRAAGEAPGEHRRAGTTDGKPRRRNRRFPAGDRSRPIARAPGRPRAVEPGRATRRTAEHAGVSRLTRIGNDR